MTHPAFFIITTAAVLLALCFIILPLRRERQSSLLIGLMVIVPLATAGLYLKIGTPSAIKPDTGEIGEVRAALVDIAHEALAHPDKAEAWARLGMAYKSLQEYNSAEHAFRRALYVENNSSFLIAELGETLLYASGRPTLSSEARQLLLQAAAGNSQKALWLLGLDALQRGDNPDAVVHLEQLWSILPPDSAIAPTVAQYLATARQEPLPPGLTASAETDMEVALALTVDILPELAARLSGEESIFIAVRSTAGGPPLAVRRITAAQLPAELQISNADGMMDQTSLGQASELQIVARVSFSGDAAPVSGDYEGRSPPLPVEADMTARVLINQVL